MDRLASGDWWWDTAFDGIGSTAVGTLIAVAALLVALRHDRRLAAQALVDARQIEREEWFLTSFNRFFELNRQVATGLSATRDDPAALSKLVHPWWRAFLLAKRQAPRADRPLMAYLFACIERCAIPDSQGEEYDRAWVATTTMHIVDTLELRLSDPEYFRKVPPGTWERLVRDLNAMPPNIKGYGPWPDEPPQ